MRESVASARSLPSTLDVRNAVHGDHLRGIQLDDLRPLTGPTNEGQLRHLPIGACMQEVHLATLKTWKTPGSRERFSK